MAKKRFIFLSEKFYSNYPSDKFPEIEKKRQRPYIQIFIKIDGINFAIPLRSNINHPYVFWTDEENRCGVDFSKAVVISDEEYINKSLSPRIRQNEYEILIDNLKAIRKGMSNYLELYKNAKLNPEDKFNKMVLTYSTLQYFEKEIGIK